MTLKDVRNSNSLENLTKVNFNEIEYLWISDYWDGARSGMIEYKNESFWFEVIQENENEDWVEGEWYRRFVILKLTKEQLEKEFEVHEDFQRYVGNHWDYKKLNPPPKFEEGKMNEFYDKHLEYVRSRPFEENIVVGWMEN